MEIPELDSLGTINVPIKVKGEVKDVVMKPLTGGDRATIIGQLTRVEINGNHQSAKIKHELMQIHILSKVIVSAPFDHTVDGLSKLDSRILDYLNDQWTSHFTPDEGKKKVSSGTDEGVSSGQSGTESSP